MRHLKAGKRHSYATVTYRSALTSKAVQEEAQRLQKVLQTVLQTVLQSNR